MSRAKGLISEPAEQEKRHCASLSGRRSLATDSLLPAQDGPRKRPWRGLSPHSVVFVSDYYAADLVGGAELSTEALLEQSPLKVIRLRAADVNARLIPKHRHKLWIFGNFSQIQPIYMTRLMAELKYMVIEYDYKFCRYRSPELHQAAEGQPCDCHRHYGRIIAAFFKHSLCTWWMSEKQRAIYEERFIELKSATGAVLSSVVSPEDLARLRSLRLRSRKRQGWAVLATGTWLKGIEKAMDYCDRHRLRMTVLQRAEHDQFLRRLARARGFVFLPRGNDTCPRVVIEAKLAGCSLVTNKYVQHRAEKWFRQTPDQIENYLQRRPAEFWRAVADAIRNSNETLRGRHLPR